MHPIIRSAETTIGWGIRSRQRARDRWFADSPLEGTGFELLVRGRVKLVVGRRRQRNRTARRSRCRCASVTFDQLVARTRAGGQGHRCARSEGATLLAAGPARAGLRWPWVWQRCVFTRPRPKALFRQTQPAQRVADRLPNLGVAGVGPNKAGNRKAGLQFEPTMSRDL